MESPSRPKTQQVNVRLAPKWRAELQALAREQGVPMAEYARHVLLRHLQRGERRTRGADAESVESGAGS
jgi:hypothetical protein